MRIFSPQTILDDSEVDRLMNNRALFESFIYSPLPIALIEYDRRWHDLQLAKKIDMYLNKDIPLPFLESQRAIIDRQLCTSNFEMEHFLELTKAHHLKPILLEYHSDKFTSNNPIKYALGKMRFQHNAKEDISSGQRSYVRTIIDFNNCNGKQICEVQTKWGQSLVEFHHGLLQSTFPNSVGLFYDASEWLLRIGKSAKLFYAKNLALFVRNGILFENYILAGCELSFLKDVFLPAFLEAWKMTGQKPLIVQLLPRKTQEERYWMSYPVELLERINFHKKY